MPRRGSRDQRRGVRRLLLSMRASRSPGAVVRLLLHRACGRAGGAALFFCLLAPHRFNCRRCHFSRRAEIVRRRVCDSRVLLRFAKAAVLSTASGPVVISSRVVSRGGVERVARGTSGVRVVRWASTRPLNTHSSNAPSIRSCGKFFCRFAPRNTPLSFCWTRRNASCC